MSLARELGRYRLMGLGCVCTAVGFVCLTSAAQSTKPDSAGTKAVHIVVEVRLLTGDPLPGLRPTDFVLLAEATPLSFRMNRSKDTSPPSVLVVLSPEASFSSMAIAARNLSRQIPIAIQSQYQMSVLGPHGEYVALQPVNGALAMMNSKVFYRKSYAQAVSILAKSKGARAIIFMTNRFTGVPGELQAAAQDAEALVYAVGEDEDVNYSSSGTQVEAGPRSAGGWDGAAEQSIRTVYAVSSVQKAFKRRSSVPRGRYRLTVHIPWLVRSIQLRPKISCEYQINAFTYMDDGEAAPTTGPTLIVLTPNRKAKGN